MGRGNWKHGTQGHKGELEKKGVLLFCMSCISRKVYGFSKHISLAEGSSEKKGWPHNQLSNKNWLDLFKVYKHYVDSENTFTFSDTLIRFHKLWKTKQTYNNMSFISVEQSGDSLVVLWLQFHPSTAGGMGLIPGQGAKILHAAPLGQENKTKPNPKQQQKQSISQALFFQGDVFWGWNPRFEVFHWSWRLSTCELHRSQTRVLVTWTDLLKGHSQMQE